MGRYTGKTCRLSVMLFFTFGFFLVEIVFGYLTNSMALVADSFHMLSDVVALIIAFFCMKISKKRYSSKNTFGWVRAEVLGALINAVFLIALCFSIFIEALKRLIEPEEVHNPVQILIVGVLGLIVNIVGIFMFHGHASVHGHSHARPVPLNLPVNGVDGVSATDDDDKESTKQQRKTLTTPNSMKKNVQKINGQMTNGGGGEDTLMIVRPGKQGDGGNLEEEEDEAVAEQLNKSVVAEAHNISIFNTGGDDSTEGKKGHGHGHNKDAKPLDAAAAQLNMHGVFLHILGDAFGSIIVIINAIINWQVDNAKLKLYLDPSLSLVLAMIIFSTTMPLFKESALILLQTVPTHINVEEIKRKLLRSIDGVLAVHEFHVWRLAGNKIIATAHIRCRNLDEYMKIAESVKQLFHDEGIHSTTIQPEFDEVADAVDQCVLECPREAGDCAPSKCCTVKSAPVLVVSTDPSSAVVSPTSSSGIEMRQVISTGDTIQGSIIDKEKSPASSSSETKALIKKSNSRSSSPTDRSKSEQQQQQAISSTTSEEEQFKGVPPILYYQKGYNQLGQNDGESKTEGGL